MKKRIILLLGIISIAMLITPQVKAIDIDVGYKTTLLVDQNAVVTVDYQAVALAPEFVTSFLYLDPGDRCMESASTALSELNGLREGSADRFNTIPLPNADVTVNDFRDYHRQCARVYVLNIRHNVAQRVLSTSNGGVGY